MNCAIIMAAGKGKRMKAGINKQFILLKNKPILSYTIDKFQKNSSIDEIIIVAAPDEIDFCRNEIVYKYNFSKVKKIVCGGKERQDSVLNGLMAAKGSDIVLIHDGARPFVDNRIIDEGIEYAKIYGGAACGMTPKDTIKVRSMDGFSERTIDRSKLFCVQTPQCFRYEEILKAHLYAKENNITATDDTMLFETLSNKVYLYGGSYNNIKITTPEDLYSAEKLANSGY
ncbi:MULTISPECIES: 2-C-methyl-D-erythritol 4-phosphate cytidylyltransferase [Clostridium]|uniref:2-C-methyl-D-erythritol 4-phosphate cytidylyltransferase n=1 Tax=Clostridium TaxID=1485 RepID=UPI00069F5828|nr:MULTISPECIES: 2-C-methyl-D-erythritol 4-phosphate cytidylyltransferase [Clostridium]KOF56860.1 2-C-methyl-D-erythritol 4-phosphate cytidylyltransferase [Clostridium sp. DMHC 10]MCD2348419.1 2-C-methyl-D-erythritol 4-phosphate cytidylyltransferase [Clostridium guangxiense]